MWIGRVGLCPTKHRAGAPDSLASLRLLESPAMFQVVEDNLGDDGMRMMEGAMESLVEEQVASSSDDVVDENLRDTADDDNAKTHVTDATPASSSASITAGSSSRPLTPIKLPESNGDWILDTISSLAGVSLVRAGGALVSSVALREILRRRIATSAATRRHASITSTSRSSFFLADAAQLSVERDC